jgi:hypothetical protein
MRGCTVEPERRSIHNWRAAPREGKGTNDPNVFAITSHANMVLLQGPLHFQSSVRKDVMEHRQKEEKAGHEIWPAAQRVSGEMKTAKLMEEESFCSKLEAEACQSSAQLAW